MKTAVLANVLANLNDFIDEHRAEPLLLTRDGRTVAILYAVKDPDDMERLVLSHSPKFQALIENGRQQAREGKGIPLAEARRMLLGPEPAKTPKAKPKPKRRKKVG